MGSTKEQLTALTGALSDPNRLKTYLIETNRKVYKGGVLPQDAGNQFQKWLERADTDRKPFTIIDAEFDVLSRDIKPKPVRNDKGEIVELSVKIEQLNTKVELGTDGNEKNYSLHLEKNAKTTKEFWQELRLPANKRNIILNEEAPAFKNFVEENDADLLKNVIKPTSENTAGDAAEDKYNLKNIGICSSKGRSRRAAGGRSNCAIFLNPNGDVDSLHPKEFIEEYKKADPE
ncbi:unnamed protein product [Orchesella dallaii]|uniref:Uncharacterized protein n=1 Tax=Orchesella dallaii TaxID=48710 RepID=A0ABP1RWG9_9HEXA